MLAVSGPDKVAVTTGTGSAKAVEGLPCPRITPANITITKRRVPRPLALLKAPTRGPEAVFFKIFSLKCKLKLDLSVVR
jgi:hypothetical protein